MGASAKHLSFAVPTASKKSGLQHERESDDEDTNASPGAPDNHRRVGESSTNPVPAVVHIPSHILGDFGVADRRIVELKRQGYTAAAIAKQLKEEGMSEYNERSVSNRWLRLRVALEQAEQEQMEDGVYDWEFNEDEELYKAVEIAVAKHQEDMKKLEDRMWKRVSDKLADGIGAKKYTGQACRERYEALQDGTALLPIEIDPDQEGRAELREDRVQEMQDFRAQQIALMQEAEDDKLLFVNDRKAYMLKRNARLGQNDAEKQADRQAKEGLRLAKKNATAHRAETQKAEIERARLGREWRDEVIDIENHLYAKLTGKSLGKSLKAQQALAKIKKRQYGILSCIISDDEKDSEDEEPTAIPPGKAKVTDETRFSPRCIMTFQELERLLARRSLPRRKPTETHEQLVARLHWTDYLLKGEELNTLLLAYFDKGKGPKDLRAFRLARHDAAASAAGLRGGHHAKKDFQAQYDGTRTS